MSELSFLVSCVDVVDVFVRRARTWAGCSQETNLLHAAIAVLTQAKPRDSAGLHPASHDIAVVFFSLRTLPTEEQSSFAD